MSHVQPKIVVCVCDCRHVSLIKQRLKIFIRNGIRRGGSATGQSPEIPASRKIKFNGQVAYLDVR